MTNKSVGSASHAVRVVENLEALLRERLAQIDEYAELWAIYGGNGSPNGLLLEMATAKTRMELRSQLTEGGKAPTEKRVEEALQVRSDYADHVRENVATRARWAKVRERMRTLDLRIQLEMSRLRLSIDDDGSDPGDADDGDN